MVKAQDEQDYTPESTVHLWSVPRRNRVKPTKDDLIQELYLNKPLIGLDFRSMTVLDLQGLVSTINALDLPKMLEMSHRTKLPFLEHLSPFKLPSLQKVPLGTLKGLVEYLNERN